MTLVPNLAVRCPTHGRWWELTSPAAPPAQPLGSPGAAVGSAPQTQAGDVAQVESTFSLGLSFQHGGGVTPPWARARAAQR